jgi:hypothetical protein
MWCLVCCLLACLFGCLPAAEGCLVEQQVRLQRAQQVERQYLAKAFQVRQQHVWLGGVARCAAGGIQALLPPLALCLWHRNI